MAALVLGSYLAWDHCSSRAGHSPIVLTEGAGKVPAFVRALRPAYPYSVIAGGAYSQAELRAAMGRDALVQRHYSNFQTESVRLVVTAADQMQYVSYRQAGRVFWTHKQLRIPRGELVLTDGKHWARARCGNQLAAERPPEQTGDAYAGLIEPTAELAMAPPSLPLLGDKRITFAAPPELGETPFDQTRLLDLLPYPVVPQGYPLATESSPFATGAPEFIPVAASGTVSPYLSSYPAGVSAEGGGKAGAKPVIVPSAPEITPIPEPEIVALSGIGLLLIAVCLRVRGGETQPRP